MMRYCRDKKGIVCYRCGKEGHVASRCVEEYGKGKDCGEVLPSGQGNDERGAGAPAVTL